MMRYGYDGGGMGWGGWLAMVMMMVVFWGAIAWVVVTLIRHGGSRDTPPASGGPDPLRILEERFARGEIDEDDYRHRRETLRADG
jgi:putative membrane protein